VNVDLSIVIPVFNEAGVLSELVARCREASQKTNCRYEIIVVDDCSTDDTPSLLQELSQEPDFQYYRNAENLGQLRSTKAGLAYARGETVVVLDGDLQDPPELIPELVNTLQAATSGLQAVFAVKESRQDLPWFVVGQTLFHLMQSRFGRVSIPYGAGSYCVMRRSVASRIVRSRVRQGNIAALVAVLGSCTGVVRYRKEARYDGRSRVGFRRLVWEAVASLAVIGALSRILWLMSAVSVFAGATWALLADSNRIPVLFTAIVGAAVLGIGGQVISFLVDRSIRPHR